ncbi:MAG: DNA polymerase IV, partial [Proteobacteria bacterium]|nr:DNA polymerase IV [Pseudomonadota bacterium]
LPLHALDEHIYRLAEKTWAAYQRERAQHPDRHARTVVLKLKTGDFRTLTRSLTELPFPADAHSLAVVASRLRERVALPEDTLYRLVGVGVSGFIDHGDAPQDELFDLD